MAGVDWDNRWREKVEHPLYPDPWLVKILPLLPAGKVLDVACGRGRNALFLAEKGYSVYAIDYSDEGLAQLRAEAEAGRFDITTEKVDLDQSPSLISAAYDVVIVFFYLQRRLFPTLMRSVRPGGTMVVRTFSRAGAFPGNPGRKEFELEPGELLQMFTGWNILLHEEGLEPSSKGGSLAGIVARKPNSASCA